jgi:hypothetical protein
MKLKLIRLTKRYYKLPISEVTKGISDTIDTADIKRIVKRRNSNGGLNLIKVHYKHVWKYYNETPVYNIH